MRLLLVTQCYHPLIGGVETHARQVAQGLAQAHTVAVAAMNFTPCRLSARLSVLYPHLMAPPYTDYEDGGVPVHSLSPTPTERARLLPMAARALPGLRRFAFDGLNRFGYRFYRPVVLPKLRRLAREADVIHCLNFGDIGWAAEEAAREAGIPFVLTPFVHPGQWGDDPENVRLLRRADAVIGLVETDRQYLCSLGVPDEKLHVIGVSPDLPPSSDPEGFRQRHGLAGVPFVLYIGRMTRHKGAEATLAAARRVWQTLPEVRFVFVGPPSAESADWFRDADPRILYLGKVSAQEKGDALAACDLFAMPSVSEILPTVYLEAWSHGKPVVGGTAPGLPELIEGNRAGLAVPQDPDDVAGAVVRIMQDDDLSRRLGRAGQELVEKNYSVPSVTRALEALYERLAFPQPAGVPA